VSTLIYCWQCGHLNPGNAVHCASCGALLVRPPGLADGAGPRPQARPVGTTRRTLGKIVKVASTIVWLVVGLVSMILDLWMLSYEWGLQGVIGGLILGPVTFIAVPLYVFFNRGAWVLLAFSYGGALLGALLMGLASALAPEE